MLCAATFTKVLLRLYPLRVRGLAGKGSSYANVGVAALGWSCFGASDHGPVSFRRVGQSVDLPGKARRWGRDLRGSRQSGCLKSRSRPLQPRRTSSPTSGSRLLCARHGRRPGWSGAETGAQARTGAGPRAVSGSTRLEPAEKVVTLRRAGPEALRTLRVGAPVQR